MKNCKIKIFFTYQKFEPFTFGYYNNTLVEDGFQVLVDTVSDENGYFCIDFYIDQPKVVILKSIHDQFKIYCKPNNSIRVEIINRFNVKFYEDSSIENNLLFSNGLSSDIIRTADNSTTEKEQLEMIFSQYNIRTSQYYKYFNDTNSDFYRYYFAEIIGNKYFQLNTLKNKLSLSKSDSTTKDYIEKAIIALKNESIIDEHRSRMYNNCIALMGNLFIRDNNNFEKDMIWRDFPDSNRVKLFTTFTKYPNLYRLISFMSVNNLIYRSKDTSSIYIVNKYLSHIENEYPDSCLITILKDRYNKKLAKLLFKTPYNFVAEKVDSTNVTLVDYKGKIILIDFWATWCKPCVEALPKIEEFAKKHSDNEFVVLAVNISDNYNKWRSHVLENNYSHIKHIRLNNKESKEVFKQYFFETVPNYVLLGKNMEILLSGIPKLGAAEVLQIETVLKK